MHIVHLVALFLLLFLAACANDGDDAMAPGTATDLPTEVFDPNAYPSPDLLEFDLLQRTCALYVAVRSSAWEGPIAFGRDIDDSMVHWNMCPGGTMVACVKAPAANGDTVITGIPWPYPAVQLH